MLVLFHGLSSSHPPLLSSPLYSIPLLIPLSSPLYSTPLLIPFSCPLLSSPLYSSSSSPSPLLNPSPHPPLLSSPPFPHPPLLSSPLSPFLIPLSSPLYSSSSSPLLTPLSSPLLSWPVVLLSFSSVLSVVSEGPKRRQREHKSHTHPGR